MIPDEISQTDPERKVSGDLYDRIEKQQVAEKNIRMSSDKDVITFHANFRDASESILITTGGAPCSDIAYQNALAGIHDYQDHLHVHDCFFISYVVRGENLEIVEGTPMLMTENDLLLLTPYTRHHNYHTADSRILFFHVNPDALYYTILPAVRSNILFADFFSDFLTDRYVRKSLFFPDCMKDVEPVLTEIVEEFVSRRELSAPYIQYLLGILMIRLARNSSYHARHFSDSMSEKMKEVVQYITAHYREITLEDTARHFGYNSAYLSRKIRQFSGKTYGQLLTDYRLNMAAIQIREGKLSIEELAYESGYNDISTFYKAFRRKYGCSPRELIGSSHMLSDHSKQL